MVSTQPFSLLKSMVGLPFFLTASQRHSSNTHFQTVPSSLPGCTYPPVSTAILAYSFSTRPMVTALSAILCSTHPSVSALRERLNCLVALNLELSTFAHTSCPKGFL